ncbi:DUF2085 domain-containing protein [Cytobacillus solani]|uniref:DUF2085 domain-containing protein n=1 Tax=Cytobacillus solani TaxID=1637975 RepID=UPI001151E046|nr:DUF2085 domain-containing protein [Cytobacillus solani]
MSRCKGISAGYLFFPILFFIDIHISILLGLFLNIPMIIDGLTQKLKFRMSNNGLRFLTGVICGLGQSILIVSISDYIVSLIQ